MTQKTGKVLSMTAHGTEPRGCVRCGRPFKRGETITAIPYVNGDPAGWFCSRCTSEWRCGQFKSLER